MSNLEEQYRKFQNVCYFPPPPTTPETPFAQSIQPDRQQLLAETVQHGLSALANDMPFMHSFFKLLNHSIPRPQYHQQQMPLASPQYIPQPQPEQTPPKHEPRLRKTDEDTESEVEDRKPEEAKKARSRPRTGKSLVVTPYLLFYRENAHFFRKPGSNCTQMSNIMANAWKKVPDDMKQRYRERADAEKEKLIIS